jgi:hypothetical protein
LPVNGGLKVSHLVGKNEPPVHCNSQTIPEVNIQLYLVIFALSKEICSLSHIAIVSPPDESLHGIDPKDDGRLHLGNLEFRGERDLLKISAGNLIIFRCNLF